MPTSADVTDMLQIALGWSLGLPLILAVYAQVLLQSARQGAAGKVVLSVAAWLTVSLVLVAALFSIVEAAGGPRAGPQALFVAAGLFVLASVPGILVWRRVFLMRLRQAGFFLPRA